MSLSVKDALHKRISTRAFLDKPVTETELRALIDDARFAASGGNLQPWKVVAVAGEARQPPTEVVRRRALNIETHGARSLIHAAQSSLRAAPIGAHLAPVRSRPCDRA